jgi:hypothetical protein
MNGGGLSSTMINAMIIWKRIIWFSLLIVLKTSTQAQFSGTINDALSEKPIANANLVSSTGINVTSWANGHFEFKTNSFPFTLSISHVGYHTREVIIYSITQTSINIFLEPKTTNINEVVVRGEKLKRYYERKNFYVVDFEFIEENICLIGFEDRQLKKGRLMLLSPSEDTLAYLHVKRPKRLYRDGYQNIQLITKDSIFQLFYKSPRFHQLFPTHVKEIPYEFFQLKFIEEDKFIYKSISGRDQGHEYFVIDTLKKERIPLKRIKNYEMEGAHSLSAGSESRGMRFQGRADKQLTEEQMERLRDMYEAYVYDRSIIRFPVHSQLFKVGEGFVLVDITNRQIDHYSPDFELIKTVKAKFPKHKLRQKEVIQDSETMKLYWVYYKGSKALLGEIEINSGKIVRTLETPSVPFIENIKIRNETIWFTYQPRLGETVRSVFRMKN